MEAPVCKAKHFATPVGKALVGACFELWSSSRWKVGYLTIFSHSRLHSDHFRTFTPDHRNVMLGFAQCVNNQQQQSGIVAAS